MHVALTKCLETPVSQTPSSRTINGQLYRMSLSIIPEHCLRRLLPIFLSRIYPSGPLHNKLTSGCSSRKLDWASIQNRLEKLEKVLFILLELPDFAVHRFQSDLLRSALTPPDVREAFRTLDRIEIVPTYPTYRWGDADGQGVGPSWHTHYMVIGEPGEVFNFPSWRDALVEGARPLPHPEYSSSERLFFTL